MYGKVFPDIFRSSLMADGGSDAIYLFMCLIVLKDRDGIVNFDGRALARYIDLPGDRFDAAMKVLMAADPDSNLPGNEGRRVVPATEVGWHDGHRGFYIVNHEHYRAKGGKEDIRAKAAARQQRFRDKKKAGGVTPSNVTVTLGNTKIAQSDGSDADTDTDIEEDLVVSETPLPVDNSDQEPNPDPDPKPAKADYAQDFEAAWQTRPKRSGSDDKRLAYRAWKARIAEGHTAEEMLAGWMAYRAYLDVADKIGTEFVMQGATFLGPADPPHFLHDWALPAPTSITPREYDDNQLMALAQRYRVGTSGKSREQLGADIRKAIQAERDEAPEIDIG